MAPAGAAGSPRARSSKPRAALQQRRMVAGGAILLTFGLLPLFALLQPRAPRAAEGKACPCEDVQRAKTALEEFQANVTREDEAAALQGTGSVAPLQRIIRRQRTVIAQQAEELVILREAAKAREVYHSAEHRRKHVYHSFIIEEDEPYLWQQRTFRKHAGYGFVSFSGYRLSPTLIVVPGLGQFKMRGQRRLQSCHWVSNSGHRTAGRLGLESMNEHHSFLYEFLLLNCTFDHPPKTGGSVDGDGTGSSSGAGANMDTSSEGGYLEVRMDQEIFYPYREEHGYNIHKRDSKGPFQYESVFCGPPMFGNVVVQGILQWLHYHRYHAGFDHFVLYDAGAVDNEFLLAFQPLIDEGLVTIQDFREGLQYDVWAQNQALAMHDCLFRSREVARWVAFHDLDEYLQVPPSTTVPAVLKKHEDQPYVSHGSYVYSTHNCEEPNVWDPQLNKFAVELLLQRWEKPYCIKAEMDPVTCLDYYGMRKVFVNPRKVLRTYIHHTDIPPTGQGMDLPVTDMWHSHFKKLIIPGKACNGQVEKSDSLKKDTSLADIAAGARACAKEGFTNQAVQDPCLPSELVPPFLLDR